MKITLLVVGKTVLPEVKTLFDDYRKRINRYMKFEEMVLDNTSIRHADPTKAKIAEGELLLKKLQATDFLVLLDEKGKQHTSVAFAKWLQQEMIRSHRHIVFVIGGAYGFSDEVYRRANAQISLSSLTFPHQLIRLIFAEQLYRAFTILNNEPYHHT